MITITTMTAMTMMTVPIIFERCSPTFEVEAARGDLARGDVAF